MPESFKAFCKMVSLTAANTSRMFVVSVAWVKLDERQQIIFPIIQRRDFSLWVKIELSAIDLIETPQQVLGRLVDITTSGIVREVIAEWRPRQFVFEQIHFVQEQNDASSREPP
jgi:hypothetical protein